MMIEVIPAPILPESQSVSSHPQRLQSPLSWVRWRIAAALWILAVAIVRMCVSVLRAFVSARGIGVTAAAVFVVLTPLDVVGRVMLSSTFRDAGMAWRWGAKCGRALDQLELRWPRPSPPSLHRDYLDHLDANLISTFGSDLKGS